MCLYTIFQRYNPPLKEVIAFGIFRKYKGKYGEGIIGQFGHSYKRPYKINYRYRAKDCIRSIFEGSEGKKVPIPSVSCLHYIPGFHKYAHRSSARIVNIKKMAVAKVKLEEVYILGGDMSCNHIYVAKYMTILEVYRDGN